MNLKDYISSTLFADSSGIEEAISSRKNSFFNYTYDEMTRFLDGLGFKNVGSYDKLPERSEGRDYGIDNPADDFAILYAQFKHGSKYYLLQANYENGMDRTATALLLIQQLKVNDRITNAAYDRKTMDEVMEIFLDLLK